MHQRRPSPRTHAGRRRRQGPRLLLHRADSDAAAGEEADGGKGAGASSRVRRGEELGGCAGWEVVEEPGPAGGELDHLVGQQHHRRRRLEVALRRVACVDERLGDRGALVALTQRGALDGTAIDCIPQLVPRRLRSHASRHERRGERCAPAGLDVLALLDKLRRVCCERLEKGQVFVEPRSLGRPPPQPRQPAPRNGRVREVHLWREAAPRLEQLWQRACRR
mmetsp:Transcript_31226/g.102973  ORF Transcript_31226/g.102973 Transcript_31226/m.102973 type:complete len:222 (-) Transcript_31226:169-834(-)